MNKHTPECIQAMKDALYEQYWWDRLYPAYCRKCEGRGVLVSSGGWVPYGMGSAQLPDDVDPCPDCTEQGECARCGDSLKDPETGEGPCLRCGWNYNDSRPQLPECNCWEDPKNWPDDPLFEELVATG